MFTFDHQPILLLYKNIENAREIRAKIIETSLHCAVLKPCYVLDPFQVLVATELALKNHKNESMKTRSVYTEIIYNMSPNKKIADSLKLFGITDEDTEALFVVVDEEKAKDVRTHVKGTLMELSDITTLSNDTEIRKVYKIKEAELEIGSLLEAVINRIATKELVTF